MSILTVTEMLGEATADKTEDGGRTYTRVYIIKTDVVHSARSIRFGSGLPRKGNTHPDDNGARVHNVGITHWQNHPTAYRAIVSYSTTGPEIDNVAEESEATVQPWDKMPEVSWAPAFRQEVTRDAELLDNGGRTSISPDLFGKLVTENGWTPPSRFDPLLPQHVGPISTSAAEVLIHNKQLADVVLTLTRAEEVFDPNDIFDYTMTVNADDIDVPGKLLEISPGSETYKFQTIGVAAGRMRMNSISANAVRGEGFTFYRVTYVIQFRFTWILEVLDAGFYMLVGGVGGTQQPIREVEKGRGQKAELLDGSGALLSLVVPPPVSDVIQAAPARHYRPFRVFPEKDWGSNGANFDFLAGNKS